MVRLGMPLLLVLSAFCAYSQSDSSLYIKKNADTLRMKKYESDTADQRDVIDVLVKIFKPKHFQRAKLQPGEKSFFILPGIYYSQPTGIAGTLNGTLTYLPSDYKYQNLSTIFSTLTYAQQLQKTLSVYSTLWTKKNRFSFQGVAWYFVYSEKTFGLGGNASNQKENRLDYNFARIYESLLKQVGQDIFIGVGYKFDYHDRVVEHGNKDGSLSDYYNYGSAKRSISSGPSIDFLFDDRRNQINPRRGSFVNLVYSPKLKFLGSDQDWQFFKADLRKYFKLSPKNNNVLALWSLSQFTMGPAPYLDLPSTQWDDFQRTGRGYIQGRFRGKNMLYFESEYRFKITHNGVLGGVAFANAQSFTEPSTTSFGKFLPAAGGGIRIKVNKYTRTNLSLYYGIGLNGSSGLFLNLGEVF
ncbi:MAG: BamA/TamA family outer membrane protein [Flavisolibacter sp.]